ncbi:MAG TPA: hypothetical protein VHZ26_01365 [Caulobacteraceae bacterium]|jgi:hypothetical protein|nr:hypothetical protein [Caulobacteraceae bacterium]
MAAVETLEARAKAQGWPDGLVERAQAVKTPSQQLQQWLQTPATPNHLFQIERIVEVFERLANGPYRARELTYRDQESFSDLWANAPEKVGDWEVTVERSPNPLAQFRLQPGCSISVIEVAGELVACTAWAPANCMIAGQPVSIHYAQALRVRGGRRGEGLGDLVRRFPARALQKPTIGQVMYMRIGNAGMAGFLEAVKFMAEGDRPQKVVGVTYLATAGAKANAVGVRPIAEADLAACAAMINRTHEGLDLFRPLGEESLRMVLDEGFWGAGAPWQGRVYGWADVHVLEEDGQILACAGLWDRGRDMREVWRSQAGEERRVEVAAALETGCAAGRDDALARLLRHLAGLAAERGRQSLIVDLEHLPEVKTRLADLDPRVESRTLEWSPFGPQTPPTLGECHIDLRYW